MPVVRSSTFGARGRNKRTVATGEQQTGPLWAWLAGALILLVFALIIASLTCGPLYMLMLPPTPPTYPNAALIAHESEAHGIDIWRYRSNDHVCEVFKFYQEKAAECEYIPSETFCAKEPREALPGRYLEFVGHCTGTGEASPFSWDWEFNLREVYPADGPAYADFDISRTMHWTP